MKEHLEQLEQQRRKAKEALEDIENTISEIKHSTGFKIHAMLEKENLNGIKKIWPKDDGTHVLFKEKEISAQMLNRFKKFKLERVYYEDGSMVAVFD